MARNNYGRIYYAKVALLHLDKPEMEFPDCSSAFFFSNKNWEKKAVNNVVSPYGH
jgi:hypothetical protein